MMLQKKKDGDGVLLKMVSHDRFPIGHEFGSQSQSSLATRLILVPMGY